MAQHSRSSNLPLVLCLAVALAACFAPAVSTQQTASVALSADGVVQSKAGGFQFPDGTVQQTVASGGTEAAQAARRLSLNTGLYDNRIPTFTHHLAFVEVCFKDGTMLIDQNEASTSTAGGNCEPGDRGWIIEREERSSRFWSAAKANCLMVGMRLPELFEQQVTCLEAATTGIVDMTDDWEWMSNTVQPETLSVGDSFIGMMAAALGGGGDCERSMGLWIGNQASGGNQLPFRCAL